MRRSSPYGTKWALRHPWVSGFDSLLNLNMSLSIFLCPVLGLSLTTFSRGPTKDLYLVRGLDIAALACYTLPFPPGKLHYFLLVLLLFLPPFSRGWEVLHRGKACRLLVPDVIEDCLQISERKRVTLPWWTCDDCPACAQTIEPARCLRVLQHIPHHFCGETTHFLTVVLLFPPMSATGRHNTSRLIRLSSFCCRCCC